MIRIHWKWAARAAVAAGLAMAMLPAVASAREVEVRVRNLAPEQGVFLTPVFIGFHGGGADLFTDGEAVSDGFERLAEDGSTEFLADEFAEGGGERVFGALPGGLGTFPPPAVLGPDGAPVGPPNGVAAATFNVDPDNNRYFSYASMVIPSNDAFIGNDDPLALELFNEDGEFQSIDFTVLGSSVLDAGTEANTETNAAFLNQMPDEADAGTETDGVVTLHEGFNGSVANPDDTPQNILGGTNPMGVSFGEEAADFKTDGYEIARISVRAVPEPASFALLGLGGLALIRRRRRRSA